MARSAEEIEKIIAEYKEKSKGVTLDITAEGITYQADSEIKPPELPWWAVLHLRAFADHPKPKTRP